MSFRSRSAGEEPVWAGGARMGATHPHRSLATRGETPSPDCVGRCEGANSAVLRNEACPVGDRRRDDDAIGWVPVAPLVEFRRTDSDLWSQIENGDARKCQCLCDPRFYIAIELESALRDQHSHFPATDHGHTNLVGIFERLQRLPGKEPPRTDPPHPGVCVSNDHRSARHATSTGSTMSSPRITLFSSDATAESSSGTSRATGWPRFVTTISSPVRATSSSRERQCDLNSPAAICRLRAMVTRLWSQSMIVNLAGMTECAA